MSLFTLGLRTEGVKGHWFLGVEVSRLLPHYVTYSELQGLRGAARTETGTT